MTALKFQNYETERLALICSNASPMRRFVYQPERVKFLTKQLSMIVVGKTLLLILFVNPRVVLMLQCFMDKINENYIQMSVRQCGRFLTDRSESLAQLFCRVSNAHSVLSASSSLLSVLTILTCIALVITRAQEPRRVILTTLNLGWTG